MTVPWREWSRFEITSLEAFYGPPGTMALPSDWTTAHYTEGKAGDKNMVTGNDYHWRPLWRPKAEDDFQLSSGMDQIVNIEYNHCVSLHVNDGGVVSVQIIHGVCDNANAWDKNLVCGRYYNAVNQWDTYPPGVGMIAGTGYDTIVPVVLPYVYNPWIASWKAGVGKWANLFQADFFRGGAIFYLSNYNPGAPGSGKEFSVWIQPNYIRTRYFNAVVNSMSRFWMPTTGGVQVVLTGLGFMNSDAELNYKGASHAWLDVVAKIYFEGLQGQGTTTLIKTSGHFTVDSNTQITIPSMPALAAGTYKIRLRKESADVGNVDAYAGDWSCDSSGRISKTERMSFYASAVYSEKEAREKKAAVVLSKWTAKNKLGALITRYYAPLDVRAPDKFYSGRILKMSSFDRAIDDKTGEMKISDMTLELNNSDNEFSKLLASYMFKNQPVDFYLAYLDEPEAWKRNMIKMIVEDYSLRGSRFYVKLKDISQKYFKIMLPSGVCTAEEFPNIHPDHVGKAMPEVLGQVSLMTGENLGAVEAVHVNTSTHEYLAAAGTMKSIDQVYSANVLKSSPGDYSITYKEGGRTYIDFVADQGNNKITFNGKGYSYGGWDSASGFVQNPAYVVGYVMAVLCKVPFSLIDLVSVEALATIYTNKAWDTSGKLILQEPTDAIEVMRQLLFSFGARCFPAKDGRYSLKRKQIDDYQTTTVIFEQLDLLEPADRQFGLDEAVNVIKANYDYIPTWNLFKSGVKDQRDDIIDDFEHEREDDISIPKPY